MAIIDLEKVNGVYTPKTSQAQQTKKAKPVQVRRSRFVKKEERSPEDNVEALLFGFEYTIGRMAELARRLGL